MSSSFIGHPGPYGRSGAQALISEITTEFQDSEIRGSRRQDSPDVSLALRLVVPGTHNVVTQGADPTAPTVATLAVGAIQR